MGKKSRWEDKARKTLQEQGYSVMRSGGSFGTWDLVAWRQDQIRFIQVKSGQGPRSAERKEIEAAPLPACPECGRKISSKEIWLYKKKNKTTSELIIERVTK